MRRPMVYIWIFLTIGILGGQCSSMMGIVLFVITITCLGFALWHKTKLSGAIMLPIISMIGFVLMTKMLQPTDINLEKLARNSENIEVTGLVRQQSGENIVLKANRVLYDNKTIESNANIKCKLADVEGEEVVEVEVGDIITIKGKILMLSRRTNPVGFDEFIYNKARNIEYKMYPSLISIDGKKEGIIDSFKNKLIFVYDEILPPKESGIIKAMILGDKTQIDSDLKELYRDAGIYHILAISGLHITILAGILILIFKKINLKHGNLYVMGFLASYCVLTGGSVSTIRATIMIYVILIGEMISREGDLLNSLSFAGVLLMAYQPLYLFDIGFQLSFSAVIGIAIFTNLFIKKFGKNIATEVLGVSVGASIMTKPVIAYHFYNINLVDLFANIIVVPIMNIVVAVGLFAGVTGMISLRLARFMVGIVFGILKVYEVVCGFVVKLPLSNILVGKPNLAQMILIYCFLFTLYYFIKYTKLKNFLLNVAVVLVFIIVNFVSRGNVEVTFLDVGQGDSTVITQRNGTYIIDGGGSAQKEFGLDTGKKVIIPYLESRGIDRVEAIFVSHLDDDHFKGILEIMGDVKINRIYIPRLNYEEDNNYETLILLAEEYKIEVHEVSKGDKFQFDELNFECLYPKEVLDSGNNGSMVLKFNYGENDILFTGDIEENAEVKMLQDNVDLKADILKVAHHGSKTSSSQEFIEAVNPSFAVVSAGKNNRYKHPSTEVVERLNDEDISLFVTADDGAIVFRMNDNKVWIKRVLGGDRFERVR